MSTQLIMHTRAPLNSESIRGASTSGVRIPIFSGRQATSKETIKNPAGTPSITQTTPITARRHEKQSLHTQDVYSNKQEAAVASAKVCLNKHPHPTQPGPVFVQTNMRATGATKRQRMLAQAAQDDPIVCSNKHRDHTSNPTHSNLEAAGSCESNAGSECLLKQTSSPRGGGRTGQAMPARAGCLFKQTREPPLRLVCLNKLLNHEQN